MSLVLALYQSGAIDLMDRFKAEGALWLSVTDTDHTRQRFLLALEVRLAIAGTGDLIPDPAAFLYDFMSVV